MVFDGQSDEGKGCWWCLIDRGRGKVAGGV